MEFVKYSSLENHYREKFIDSIRLHGYEKIPYIITEKVHGANFSFWTDGLEVRVASRTQFVDGTFYNCQEVIDRYTPVILHLWENYFSGSFLENTLTVYGELYGPKIQKGINYGSSKDFVAFDVAVNGKLISPKEAHRILDGHLPTVPVIEIVSSLTEALEFNNVFASVLGSTRGVTDENNIVEGVVITPYEDVLYLGYSRLAIKSKNEKWVEKAAKPKEPRKPVDNALIEIASQYVNMNRVDAVRSKMGEITNKDFGILIKNVCTDVIEDLIKDEEVPSNWRELDEYKELGKATQAAVVPFLKKEVLPKL
jgi:Rnl2 family RNA ligase